MSESSTLPQPVNWEAVRMLALVVGVRESARRMGLSEASVMQRSKREGWLADPEAKQLNKMAIAQRSGLTVAAGQQLSATAVYQGELIALGQKSRLSLARGIAKAGEHIESLDGAAIVADAGNVKSIAQTADLVHGWKDAAPQVKIRLDVLSGSTEAPIIDVAADVSDSWTEESASTDLDDY